MDSRYWYVEEVIQIRKPSYKYPMTYVTIFRDAQPELSSNESSILKLVKSYLRSSYSVGCFNNCHVFEINYWTYDHAKSVCQGDNPNKKTLMNIPDLAYSYSPVVLAIIGLRWGKSQLQVGCVCSE